MATYEESAEKGFITRVPHFNSVLNFFDSENATAVLQDFVRLSAVPMAGLETQFAIDGTGFSGARYEKWFDEKWGTQKSQSAWVKLHAVVGTRTNVVAACVVTPTACRRIYARPWWRQFAS